MAITLLLAQPGVAERAVLVDVGPEVVEDGRRPIRAFVRGAAAFGSLEDFIDRVAAYDPYRSREHVARTARYNLMRRADGKYVSKHDTRRRHAEAGRRRPPAGSHSRTSARSPARCRSCAARAGCSRRTRPRASRRRCPRACS